MAHPKGVLIERLQKEGRQPRFESRMSGPDHEPQFDAEVVIDDEILGRGTGPNKRSAEREAAEQALAALDEAGSARSSRGGRSRKRGSGASKSAGAKGGSAGSKRKAAAPKSDEPAAPTVDAGEPFDGPWPVFESVLSTSLRIAHDRIAAGLASDDARERIESFALTLYKNLLLDLGDVVEEDASE